MQTIEIDGEEYTVSGKPSMGTVKFVQEMEIDIMRRYLDDEALLQIDAADGDMSDVMENADIDDLKGMMWDRSLQEPLQTICLAVDDKITVGQVEEMDALEFKELKEASEEALGGTATDFIEELGIGISSQVSELQEEVEASETTSQEMPPTVSGISSSPSAGSPETGR